MPKPAQRFVTRSEAARRLGVAVNTMESWVHRGRGPAFVRTGERRGKTLYDTAELERWQIAHTIRPSKPK
jgi:DNA-directed RNA polymerase specialized sigma24 family protein